MPKLEVMESFEWMTPEFKIVDAGKKTIRVRGIALRGDTTTRNNRRYCVDELKRAARSFIGKPVTINHDMHKKAGHVTWMEWNDKENALEYLADIKKNPYVDMLRDGSTHIKGVSIEANYLRNICVHCGKEFLDNESLALHLDEDHFIKDFKTEPRGIVGTALSLVLSPEEPGYPGSTVELMEMYKPGLRLLETVISKNKEIEEMKKKLKGKAVITPNQRITVDAAKKLMEQEHDCGENEHWDADQEKCVPNEPIAEQETPVPPCPEGWHEVEGKCVKDVTEQEEPPTPPCPDGWHEVDGKCVKDAEPVATEQDEGSVVTPPPVVNVGEPPTLEPACPEGFHREGEDCVVDEPVAAEPELPAAPMPVIPAETPPSPAPIPPETVATLEIVTPKVVLPTMLKLGEPFAGYDSHDDCVSKNPDKEDPNAYCADIKRKTEGETVKETALPKDVYEALTSNVAFTKRLDTQSYQRDVVQAEAINKINNAIASLVQTYPKLAESKKKTITQINTSLGKIHENFETLRLLELKHHKELTDDAKQVNEQITKTIKAIREFYTTKLSQLATAIAKESQLQERNVQDIQKLATAQTTESQLREKDIAEIRNLATEQKTDFEKLLNIADEHAKKRDTKIKTLEERIKEQEEQPEPCEEGHHRNEQGECVPDEPTEEVKELKETVAKLETNFENFKDKLKGDFKGQSPKLKESVKEHPEDPITKKKGN